MLGIRTFGRRVWKSITSPQLDTVQKLKARHPDFDAVRARILAAGTDSLSYFGNGYEREGGLSLQQNPDEFASLTLSLRNRIPNPNYLEIGSASGGACRFIHQEVGLGRVISLDDGNHPRAPEQAENFLHVPNFTKYLGDSHAPAARDFLDKQVPNRDIDIAFIDPKSHSYEGAWQDLVLTLPFCKRGALVIFHDTVACEPVRRVWNNAIERKMLKPLAEFVGDERPLGISVNSVI